MNKRLFAVLTLVVSLAGHSWAGEPLVLKKPVDFLSSSLVSWEELKGLSDKALEGKRLNPHPNGKKYWGGSHFVSFNAGEAVLEGFLPSVDPVGEVRLSAHRHGSLTAAGKTKRQQFFPEPGLLRLRAERTVDAGSVSCDLQLRLRPDTRKVFVEKIGFRGFSWQEIPGKNFPAKISLVVSDMGRYLRMALKR